MPPLRARREDIPLLTKHFLSSHGRGLTIGAAALEALVAYDWPGNVRQLARVVERAIALTMGSEIGVGDLPEQVRSAYRNLAPATGGRGDSLRAWSSRYVRLVLERCRGNKRRACDVLDISYHTLQAHLAYAESGSASGSALTCELSALSQHAPS